MNYLLIRIYKQIFFINFIYNNNIWFLFFSLVRMASLEDNETANREDSWINWEKAKKYRDQMLAKKKDAILQAAECEVKEVRRAYLFDSTKKIEQFADEEDCGEIKDDLELLGISKGKH
ncbi:hypothetical protein ENBRE01_2587 [Enteropsectra breve]|nr:hypothetical protein ENBRE01_2587 [Enteropsectra breve]